MKNISEIKHKIKRGDIEVAAKMLNINYHNANKALIREGSKHHQRLLDALTKIIEMREKLIEEAISC